MPRNTISADHSREINYMAGKSKFFKVATEGDTTDGRKIQRNWIEQAAKNFNQAKYGARVWLEHIRGTLPDSPFRAFGDVTAVKAEENGEGKMVLYAQIDPTPDLVAMNKERQKVYTSIEIDPDFAGTGEAYMVGLAVTDSPASLGTEMLAFSAQSKQNPLAARKQRPENLFTAAVETQLEFEADDTGPSLFAKVKELLSKNKEKSRADFSDITQAVEAVAEETANSSERVAQLNSQVSQLSNQLTTLQGQLEQNTTDFNQLKGQLEREPNTPPRTPATGGDNQPVDCL